jgi:hypothetical protein
VRYDVGYDVGYEVGRDAKCEEKFCELRCGKSYEKKTAVRRDV